MVAVAIVSLASDLTTKVGSQERHGSLFAAFERPTVAVS